MLLVETRVTLSLHCSCKTPLTIDGAHITVSDVDIGVLCHCRHSRASHLPLSCCTRRVQGHCGPCVISDYFSSHLMWKSQASCHIDVGNSLPFRSLSCSYHSVKLFNTDTAHAVCFPKVKQKVSQPLLLCWFYQSCTATKQSRKIFHIYCWSRFVCAV